MVHSIRFKIFALTIGAILTSILCVFLASSSTIQEEVRRRSTETMFLIGDDAKQSIEKYTESLDNAVDIVGNIASDSLDSTVLVEAGVVGSTAPSGERTPEQIALLDDYLADYCATLQKGCATVAANTKGVITYYFCIAPEISTTQHGFFYSKVGKTGFGEREPLDARGFDPSDREHYKWYYAPIERGRPSYVGPYTAHFLDEMQICSYIIPLYKAGTLIGVIGMGISVDTLIEQVSSIKVYDTGFVCLLDEEGHVIYHPELEYGTIPDLSVTPEVLREKTSVNGLVDYSDTGEERQMCFTTLSNGMKLVIVAPSDEVNASSYQLTRIIIATAIAVIAVFTLIVLFGAQLITEPLQRLTAASQRLAAADYDVELDYHGQDEVGALTGAFQSMRDQLKADIEDLNRKAYTDSLTGLPNQRHFFDLAESELVRLREDGKDPVVLFFNLIGMKHFNRQYGFDQGDKLICEVADIIAGEFGAQHSSRFGQDHFVVVTDEDRTDDAISRVFEQCRSANGGVSLPVSVGIYHYKLATVDISVASDRAKYACDQRRGSYISGTRSFDAGMARQIDLVRHIIGNLDRALEDKWVKVYYQPIIRAVNGHICDEEALSRWIDPELGFLSPADFIPALENAGLIYKLDLYVLDEVLAKMQRQRERGLTVVPHSINLSRSDFDSCDIVEEIRQRVDAAGIARHFISIEITESIIGSNFDFMQNEVRRFRALGFPVWMDDFGSGYSSLDVLQSIEFDLLKFDMSFLRRFDDGDTSKVILTDLMKMATSLGVDTICEGVETQEQSFFLHEIGCAKLQGYYYSRPLPVEQVLELSSGDHRIGYENLDETGYYSSIGKVNLYDPSISSVGSESASGSKLGSIPMAVLELHEGTVSIVRANKSYREFVSSVVYMPHSARGLDSATFTKRFGKALIDAMPSYQADGDWAHVSIMLYDGTAIHAHISKLAVNPVTDAQAYAVIIYSLLD